MRGGRGEREPGRLNDLFGDTVVILESMKMEIPVEADHRGKVSRILISEGEVVDEGTPLLELE